MRRTIEGECFSCHDKMPMNFMPRAVVNGKDVLLCRSCNYHFENGGHTPQPIIFPATSIHCDQCKRLYTKVDIYQVNDMRLCLLCESMITRTHKPAATAASGARLSFSWRTGIVVAVLLLSIIGVTKGEEFFDPMFTSQQEVSEYVQTVTNPLNELNNQLMEELGIAGGTIEQEKAVDYKEKLNHLSLQAVSKEEELLELAEGEKHKIEILEKMISTSQIPDAKKRVIDIESLVSELQSAHEQGNEILTGLFDKKEIKYNKKEGELMHVYYIGGK
ncbi:hypothetical protein [Lysinibacillus sp. 3P01SB]|uniref:hypothetical protein n=1 Tax=Lysinibacillus sp. 3P01SB TaxID=3132284 RepID=UPI0039A54505